MPVVRYLFAFLALAAIGSYANQSFSGDTFATSANGTFVLLKDDGTWRLSNENGGMIDHKVNLTLNLLEPVQGGCRATFMLANMTKQTFPDFLPVIRLFDSQGIEIGQSSLFMPSFGTELAPNGLLYLKAETHGRICWEITRAVISGFEGTCRNNSTSCGSLLFVHPNVHLPIDVGH